MRYPIGRAPHYWGMPRRTAWPARDTFADVVERHRAPIHLLCYRLTGSFDDAIRLGYDTFLTGWRLRRSAPADLTGWLTAIAVRACVEHVRRRRPAQPRRPVPSENCVPRSDVTWLQPYPDRLLPDATDAATIGLPFVAASQSLTARDRAMLVLTDVEGWPQARAAGALRMPNSDTGPRLARARSTMRAAWTPTTSPRSDQPVPALTDAFAAADLELIDGLLHDDVQLTLPPLPFSFDGRTSVIGLLGQLFGTSDPTGCGRRRCVPTRANRQPAFAVYTRRGPDGGEVRGHGLVVVRTEHGMVVELTIFEPRLLPAFGLPVAV